MAKTASIECRAWVAEFDLHAVRLEAMPLDDLQTACDLVRGKLDAIEARRLAVEVGADGDDRRARKMARASGRRSKRTARAAARRAAAVAKNNKLADDLESGALSSEQLDAVADAAAGDESAATDEQFIDEIKKRNADQARKFAAKRKHQGTSAESVYDKQRRLRRASRWKDFESGLSMLQLGGDDATIDELWTAVLAREKQLKQQDGGRDVPTSQHPRTFDQRLFDAAVELLRCTGSSSGTPSVVISVSAESGEASVAGGGPVSDEYVRSILDRAQLSVLVHDRLSGAPLWLGRSRRRASDGQVLALIVRDHGCVLCGAHWVHCEAHHRVPWNAPGKGETDIDEMALLCVGCHHRVHDDHLTVVMVDGVWTTRPALDHEIARCGTPARRRTGSGARHDRFVDHRSGNRRATSFGPDSGRSAGRHGQRGNATGHPAKSSAVGSPARDDRAMGATTGPRRTAPERRADSSARAASARSGDPDSARPSLF